MSASSTYSHSRDIIPKDTITLWKRIEKLLKKNLKKKKQKDFFRKCNTLDDHLSKIYFKLSKLIQDCHLVAGYT